MKKAGVAIAAQRGSEFFNRYFREVCVGGVLLLLLLTLAVAVPHFYEPQPLLSRLVAQVPVLIAALGITLVMICRHIDISVGSQFGLCAVLAGALATQGVSLTAIVPICVIAGAILGAVNGLLVAFLNLPSIVVTLATMVTWAEALRLYQRGQFINLPTGMQWVGFPQQPGQIVLLVFGVTLVAAAAAFLKNITAGRFVYAVGSNAESARLAGISPRRTTFAVFVVAGALVGLAAVTNVVQSPQVDPKAGAGLELKVIAAVVVGGVAVTGGRGNVWGVFLGLLLLATINPALTYLKIAAYWERAIQGAVILAAVAADGLRNRRQEALA